MNARSHRRARLGAALAQAGADLAMVTSVYAMKYLIGWANPSKRLSALLIAPDGRAALAVPALEVDEAKHADIPLFPWKDGTDPYLAVRAAAESLGASPKVLGVEKEFIPLGTYEKAAGALGAAGSADLSPLISAMRAHKDEAEVALLQKASDMLNPALDAAVAAIRPGMTESEVAAILEQAMRDAGADGVAFETHVLAGAKSALPHGSTGSVKIQEGDVVLMDFGAMLEGYRSDITRCVTVGAWHPEIGKIYDIVLAAHDAAVAATRPGVTYEEIDRAARSVIEAAGYGQYFTHRTGHGLGMEVHEEPYCVAGNKQVAEPGHVFTIEPGIYLPGVGGIRIEDDVLVTEDGCRLLTSWPTTKRVVGA